MSLKIDSEFKNLIPPLTPEEYQQLEQNLIKDGCLDPLITWGGTIIDGHNRYEICSKHKMPYQTKEHQFGGRDEAKEWIILNQFGRRNLSPYQRGILALQLKPIFKAKARENQLSTLKQNTVYQNSDKREDEAKHKVNTDKELAKIAGCSHDTIFKIEKIQSKATEDVKQKVKDGEMSISQGYMSTRPKEDKPISPKPIQPKPEFKASLQKENSGPKEPEPESETIFNIPYFQSVVNGFLKEVNPLSFSKILIQQMNKKTKREYITQLNNVRKWLNIIEKNIKSNMEG